MSPDFFSCLNDYFQLALLVCHGNLISDNGRGKTALRTQSQALKRHVLAGLPNLSSKLYNRLPAWGFCAHQAQNDDLVVWNLL